MYDSVITGKEMLPKSGITLYRCFWRDLMSILYLVMLVLCVCALKLLSGSFLAFFGTKS